MSDQPVTTAPDPTPWLLEGEPSMRYATLTKLLEAAPDAPEVQEARRAIMREGPVPRILAAQQADGHFCERDRYYTDKYRGTVWTLLILAELGADGADERVRAACEAILRDAQDPDSGGFSTDRSKKAGGGLHTMVAPSRPRRVRMSRISSASRPLLHQLRPRVHVVGASPSPRRRCTTAGPWWHCLVGPPE